MYVKTKVSVSKGQAEKVAKAIESGRSVTIRLSNSDLVGDHVIAVTQSQLNKIERARAQGVGIDLTLSKAQLKHNRSIEGGFIAAILPWLARAGSFLLSSVWPGLFSGAASAAGERAVNAIANSASGSGLLDDKTDNAMIIRDSIMNAPVGRNGRINVLDALANGASAIRDAKFKRGSGIMENMMGSIGTMRSNAVRMAPEGKSVRDIIKNVMGTTNKIHSRFQ